MPPPQCHGFAGTNGTLALGVTTPAIAVGSLGGRAPEPFREGVLWYFRVWATLSCRLNPQGIEAMAMVQN